MFPSENKQRKILLFKHSKFNFNVKKKKKSATCLFAIRSRIVYITFFKSALCNEFRKVHNRYKYQLENFFAISLGIQDLFTKRVHAIVFNCAITNSFMQLLTTDSQWGNILSYTFMYLRYHEIFVRL